MAKIPRVVNKRFIDKHGMLLGCEIKGMSPNTFETMSAEDMFTRYVDGVDFIIEKGTNVSELMIIHRKTENGMTYYFRSIADGNENNNFAELPTEIRDSL